MSHEGIDGGYVWGLLREVRYTYDRWNLICEEIEEPGGGIGPGNGDTKTTTKSYLWGLDLSGQRSGKPGQEAGGIGGLLAITVTSTDSLQPTVYLPISDHNGNIQHLVDAASGQIAASYVYSPFGVLVAESGPAKDVCPLRFMSKYYDEETGFYYFGYRYYDPASAKWLSNDVLGEEAGINLTQAFGNDPVNNFDPLGLDPLEYAAMWSVSLGLDNKRGIYLDTWGFSGSVRQRNAHDFEWEFNIDQRIQLGGGLGTPVGRTDIGLDTTLSAFATWGEGEAAGIPKYSINYMSRSPFENTFSESFTWGQSWNWNFTALKSGLDVNYNRLGFVQWRNGADYLYYANDVDQLPKLPPWKSERDRYWTAEALIGHLDDEGNRIELCWQDFTGEIIGRNRRINNVYRQTEDQVLLNRSEWYLRYAPSDSPLELTIGRTSPGWANAQNWIHWLNNSGESAANWLFNNPAPAYSRCGYFQYPECADPRYSITVSTFPAFRVGDK